MELLKGKNCSGKGPESDAIPSIGKSGLHTLSEIILTKEGDRLLEIGGGDYHRDMPVCVGGNAIGVHKYCMGMVRVYRTSQDWHTVHCRRCSLRVQVPIAMSTYGSVSDWLEARIWAESVEKFNQT